MGKKVHDAALTVDELTQRALKARTLLGEIRALFPEAHGLAKDDRRLSQGKMGADEAEALRGVVDAMDLQPAVFDSLADDDEGHLLSAAADDLVVVDRKGDDKVWALGEYVSDRDIEHALGPEPDADDAAASPTSRAPTAGSHRVHEAPNKRRSSRIGGARNGHGRSVDSLPPPP